MKLCSICWEEDCIHDKGYKREIDDSIADIIISLNKKGYKTTFCCGGHNRNPDDIYISFNKWFCPNIVDEKKEIGTYWKYTRYNSTIRATTPREVQTEEDSKAFLEKRREELRNWISKI